MGSILSSEEPPPSASQDVIKQRPAPASQHGLQQYCLEARNTYSHWEAALETVNPGGDFLYSVGTVHDRYFDLSAVMFAKFHPVVSQDDVLKVLSDVTDAVRVAQVDDHYARQLHLDANSVIPRFFSTINRQSILTCLALLFVLYWQQCCDYAQTLKDSRCPSKAKPYSRTTPDGGKRQPFFVVEPHNLEIPMAAFKELFRRARLPTQFVPSLTAPSTTQVGEVRPGGQAGDRPPAEPPIPTHRLRTVLDVVKYFKLDTDELQKKFADRLTAVIDDTLYAIQQHFDGMGSENTAADKQTQDCMCALLAYRVVLAEKARRRFLLLV